VPTLSPHRPTRFPIRALRSLAIGLVALAAVPLAPSPAAAAPSGVLVFRGDFETGDLRQWHRAERPAAARIRVVSNVRRHGRYAARFELRPREYERSYSRAELNTYATRRFREGDDLYFAWSTRFSPRWRDSGRWGKFLQWKQEGSGPPPIGMDVERDQLFLIAHRTGWKSTRLPIARGAWHDFVVHVRFSSNPRVGFVEMWHDGVLVQRRHHVPTLDRGQFSYLKQGYYRAPDTRVGNVLWHDGMRVGRSLADVARRR